MYKLYIWPAEGISTSPTHGETCPETPSVEDTNVLRTVLGLIQERFRECIGGESDVHVHLESTCTLSSSSLLLQTTNQEGRKEEKATANRGRLDWSYAGLLDKPSGVVV